MGPGATRSAILTAAVAVAAGAGCRQIFGIDDTQVAGHDGPAGGDGPVADAAVDGPPGQIDAPPPDATVDAAPCPVTYLPVPGITGSTYRLAAAAAVYDLAVTTCAADLPGRAHLLVVDDAPENTAIASYADASTASIWVGITDQAMEGTWVNALGVTQTFLPWLAGQPNGGTSQNCGQMELPSGEWRDHPCGNALDYVCECR